MTEHWSSQYVGLPFGEGVHGRGPDAYDCYQLVRKVYAEIFGYELPQYEYTNADASHENALLINAWDESWRSDFEEVTTPQEGDIVLFRSGAIAAHMGVVTIPPYFLHTLRKIDACQERYDSPAWKPKVLSFHRLRRCS